MTINVKCKFHCLLIIFFNQQSKTITQDKSTFRRYLLNPNEINLTIISYV